MRRYLKDKPSYRNRENFVQRSHIDSLFFLCMSHDESNSSVITYTSVLITKFKTSYFYGVDTMLNRLNVALSFAYHIVFI